MADYDMTDEEHLYYCKQSNQKVMTSLPKIITNRIIKTVNYHALFRVEKAGTRYLFSMANQNAVFQTLTPATLVTSVMYKRVIYLHWIGENGPLHAIFVTHDKENTTQSDLVLNAKQQYEIHCSIGKVGDLFVTLGVLDMHICALCGAGGCHKKCAQCHLVTTRYCSKACQIVHWRRHKKYCARSKE